MAGVENQFNQLSKNKASFQGRLLQVEETIERLQNDKITVFDKQRNRKMNPQQMKSDGKREHEVKWNQGDSLVGCRTLQDWGWAAFILNVIQRYW